MPRWRTPWHASAENRTWRTATSRPTGLIFSYEKDGVIIRGEPIPWNADTIWAYGSLKLPAGIPPLPKDIQLFLSTQKEPLSPSAFKPTGTNSDSITYDVEFRLPPMTSPIMVSLQSKGRHVWQTALGFISRQQFLDQLSLRLCESFVQLEEETYACRCFPAEQGQGVAITANLHSPYALAAIAGLDFHVEYLDEKLEESKRFSLKLTHAQRSGHDAQLLLNLPKRAKKPGKIRCSWNVEEHILARQDVEVLPLKKLKPGLKVLDSRFILQSKTGSLKLQKYLATSEEYDRIGPCFVLSHDRSGLVMRAAVKIIAVAKDSEAQQTIYEQEVLLPDGPLPIVPGTFSTMELGNFESFDIYLFQKKVASLNTGLAPKSSFDAEGSFDELPSNYKWSDAAEEELLDRLTKLMG